MNRLALAAAALLAGCPAANDSAPTWYADVEPLVVTHCATCHQPGGIGPGDWSDYEQIREVATLVELYVESGVMPLPSSDPSCRDYHGSERLYLQSDDRRTILDWVEAGTPLGDEADRTPGLEPYGGTLAGTDARLAMPSAHTVTFDSDGNEHFCRILDNPFTETTWVTGIDVDLGERSVVHHMLLAVDFGGDAGAEYGATDPENGFDCSDQVVESDWLLLHAWTPGMEPVEFGEGQGLKVEPGQQLVLQMHYFGDPDAPAVVDDSAYLLRTTTVPQQEVEMVVTGPDDFTIPAGDPAYVDSSSWNNNFGVDLEILGAFPHMHLLGRTYRAWVREDGADTCMLDGTYDFDHQMTYMFREPMLWKQGTRVVFECTWDNSADNPSQFFDPPQTIRYGEGTTEEMCFLLFYVTVAR